MGFEPHQIRQLARRPSSRHIHRRERDGKWLSYLEGAHVIAEANRIFGFDGWSRETVEAHCVWAKQSGQRYGVAYTMRVRITVHAGDRQIIREGLGAGEAFAFMPGQAHERAAKAAETDATKRALVTFGNPFGLSLYRKPPEGTQSDRAKTEAEESSGQSAERPPSALDEQTSRNTQASAIAGTAERLDRPPNGHRPPLPAENSGEKLLEKPVNGGTEFPLSEPKTEPGPQPTGHIDRTQPPYDAPKRDRDPHHLKKVAARPCLICGRNRAHAHHLTFLQPKALGRKVSDAFTVPLCATHHRELHAHGNEPQWWQGKGINPVAVASKLWREGSR